jgi:hypothetical protein
MQTEQESTMPKQWPAQTQQGNDCKNCLKKERGVFCHSHLNAGEPAAAAAASSTRTGRANAQREWPAHTQKGDDCKNCLKKERGTFCHTHSSRDVSCGSSSSGNSTAAAAATTSTSSASKAATADWPALTAKGTDCSLCYKLGANNFCRHHSSSSTAAAAASTVISASRATAAEQAWPALNAKGEECKNCLKKETGVFCHSHRGNSSSSGAASNATAAAATATSSSSRDHWQDEGYNESSVLLCSQRYMGVFCAGVYARQGIMARVAVRNGIAHLDAVQRDFAAVSSWAAKAGFEQSAVSTSINSTSCSLLNIAHVCA